MEFLEALRAWFVALRDGPGIALGPHNFLRVGELVVVSAFGVPQDDVACRMLDRLLPGVNVVPR